MFGLSFITEAWIETFLYILLRFAGMIIVSPIFGRKNLPAIFRIGLCAMLSIIVIMLLPPSSYTRTTNLFGFFTNAVMETVLGMLIGYLSLIGLSIAIAAGQIIDMQIGFGMANFFDKQLGMQIALTGSFLNIIVIMVFFMTNGHHKLIQLLFGSFQIMGPGKVIIGADLAQLLILYFTWFMVLVIQVAMPIIAVTITAEFALGIIIKTMPQMNVFVVGIPLKIVLGLVVMMLFLPAFIMLLQGAFDVMFEWHEKIILGLMAK